MNKIKSLLFLALTAGIFTGCVKDDDFEVPFFQGTILSQKFEDADDNTVLAIDGWKNISSQGSTVWKIQRFDNNGYAEFNPFGSTDAVSVGWLITPTISLTENNSNKLTFQTSQSFVTSAANKLEVLASTDFDGTNFATATWKTIPLNITFPSTNFTFTSSGSIDLSEFSGNVNIAFKVTGSGTDGSLDGAYQIDNVRVYN